MYVITAYTILSVLSTLICSCYILYMKNMERVGNKLFLAVAYGDAAGLPFETKTAGEISRVYGRVDTLEPTNYNDYFAVQDLPGKWSDDTHLSLAVAEGLIRASGFDLSAQVDSHIKAYWESPKTTKNGRSYPLGWGGSTVRSVERLISGASVHESGEVDGAGNGVLMKQAPLAYWHYARKASQVSRSIDIAHLTRMTHDSDVAEACSQMHAGVLEYLLEQEKPKKFDKSEFTNFVINAAQRAEHDLPGAGQELSTALNYLGRVPSIKSENILNYTDGKGFYAPQTLAMAYGVFIANNRFVDSVFEAVNLGGDTDSIASIVGTMSLFLHKDVRLPDDAKSLENRDRLEQTGKQLAKAAMN